MKQQSSELSCKDVLSAFAVEPNHDRSTLERYLREFPQYAIEIASLSNEISRPPANDRKLTDKEKSIIDAAWRQYSNSSSTVPSNIFTSLSVPQLRATARALELPLQVMVAFREQRVKVASIPKRFLGRLAAAMNSTIDEINMALNTPLQLASVRSHKSEEKPVAAAPATFEQLLIEAQVAPEKVAELMAEGD
jgi:hypothetical protein